jgi:ADP-ribose pyrophosphatase YjhB (NUDIX family)
LLDEVKGVRVADEFRSGKRFTKFPGGALEQGEGTRDCLVREWREELDQGIEVTEHFYTTDFYQVSAFNPKQQVISIYYCVKALNDPAVKISVTAFDFEEEKDGAESFRWIAPKDFHETMLTFPIDRFAGKMIKEKLLK